MATLSGTANDETLSGMSTDDEVFGLGGNDLLSGLGGNDTLYGGDDEDSLLGGEGTDLLFGDAGNDTLDGGAGPDSLDGGAGIDTVSYAGSNASVAVDLSTGTGRGGWAEGDTLSNVENVIGSNFGDALAGNAAGNILDGRGGADALSGGGGADIIYGGAGTDFIRESAADVASDIGYYGGADFDRMFVSPDGASLAAMRGVDIDSIEWLQIESDGASDLTVELTAEQIKNNFDYVIADFHAGQTRTVDIEMGAETTLDLSGTFFAGFTEPADGIVIRGDADAETIVGSSINDTIIGGAGADSIDGGGGVDTADYSGAGARIWAFLDGSAGLQGDAAGDTLTNVENLVGTDFNDLLYGDANSNTIWGGNGADILTSNGGSDVLYGGGKNDIFSANDGAADTLDGGSGFDLVSFSNASAALTIDVANPSNSSASVQQDTLISIEGYIGAAAFSNTMTGGSDADFFFGNGQADVLNGNGGGDFLVGSGGDDTMDGGVGSDVLDGGADFDLLTGGDNQDIFQIRFGNDVDVILDWVSGVGTDEDLFLIRGTSLEFGDLVFSEHAAGETVGGYTFLTDSASFTLGSGADQTTVLVEGAVLSDPLDPPGTLNVLDTADNFLFI